MNKVHYELGTSCIGVTMNRCLLMLMIQKTKIPLNIGHHVYKVTY